MKNDRLTRDTAPDTRGDIGASEDAQRTTDDGLISDDEFSRILNSDFEQAALPTPPEMPGWHFCWVPTTSSYDTPARRQRIGYIPVRQSELPTFDASNGKSIAGHEGAVTCNEMLLMRIQRDRHEQLMTHFHHKRPLQEEGGIVEAANRIASEQDSAGRQVGSTVGDGIKDIEESVRRAERAKPTFS